ncbi:calcium/sodium antiporter [Gaoshiqia sediminis]|uniref:Calcium/sodium antiporter n=1 Tax=Gaoshiqia sediminis TaxID=2986998 RepID=A0AA41Y869_9BACT|nr:calcium/sodium antiporter [Gaoshiqia sediminis]MCW0483326.1 calcium/sodium antiporter [Gaoshiqia sediminis]
MLLQVLLLVGGFVLLIKGADWLITGASALGKKFNISDLAIGLTIVAFGTSAPELVVNAIASFNDKPDLVFGNVIGSNNINLFVILGITGLITPLAVKSSTAWKEIPISFGAIMVLFVLANDFAFDHSSLLSRIDGLLLMGLFVSFLFYVYKEIKSDVIHADLHLQHLSNLKIALFILIGIGGLVGGGKMVMTGAVEIARMLGVSEKIIGLTIVALGTSLPELMTSVVAALKKNVDIAVGNIIGSNVFNIFLILSVSSLIRPISFQASFNTDLYVLAGGTLFLFLAMFAGGRKQLDRWEAAILLLAYLAYTYLLIRQEVG